MINYTKDKKNKNILDKNKFTDNKYYIVTTSIKGQINESKTMYNLEFSVEDPNQGSPPNNFLLKLEKRRNIHEYKS
jgi:outer membrane lipopolysaccharide assembly protein LptE/RlpB